MAVVARWWNGRFGRLARRDVRLSDAGGRWTVEAVEGGVDGRSASWAYTTEEAARAQVDRWSNSRRERNSRCGNTLPAAVSGLPQRRRRPRQICGFVRS